MSTYNPEADLRPVFGFIGSVFRFVIVFVGSLFPAKFHQYFEALLNYFYVGRWLAEKKLWPRKWVSTKKDVLREFLGPFQDKKVVYLEFGVFHGESMRFVSNFLTHPETKFFGFDGFLGLPETWNEVHPLHSLDVHNQIPKFDDKRVQLVVGMFDQTLKNFKLPDDVPIFVNIDSDLHSSAVTVLDFIKPHLNRVAGIYFDEFNHKHHELRAFQDFLSSIKMQAETVVADRTASYLAFRLK